MILNYILSFSIFIISAGSLAELFIHSSLKNTKQQTEFIKHTKQKIDQKGIGTFLGLTTLLLFSSFFYFYLLLSTTQFKEIRNRKDIYLCSKKYLELTNSYTNAISKINIAFDALNVASATGLATPESEATRKALKLAQAGIHVSYLKNINSIKYCSIESRAQFMLNLPYETSKAFFLETAIDGKTKVREKKWELKISKIEKGIRYKHLFYLDLLLNLESIYSCKLTSTIKEVNLLDLSNLKPLSGLAH